MNSSQYWENRYKSHGNSGLGSRSILASYKADIINKFIHDNNIENIVEFGCGDGYQLNLFNVKNYTGYDVSKIIIKKCKDLYINSNKKFFLIDNYDNSKYDASLSLDVIYHLVEDSIFESYMNTLFDSSDIIIIYSSNFDKKGAPSHIKHRKFTDWILSNRPEFKLYKEINNIHTSLTCANFFIYKKQ